VNLLVTPDSLVGVPAALDPRLVIGNLATAGVAVHVVSGDHQSIVHAPHVKDLAEQLRHCLDQATAEARATDLEIPVYSELHPA